MSSKIFVELEVEQLESIVVQELKYARENLINDSIRRQNGVGMAVFDMNKAADIRAINKHIKALELILNYYGGSV